jgi:hypothetical protein
MPKRAASQPSISFRLGRWVENHTSSTRHRAKRRAIHGDDAPEREQRKPLYFPTETYTSVVHRFSAQTCT